MGPSSAAAQVIETHVGGDAVQPRPQGRPTLEAIDAAPGSYQRFLDRVLGVDVRSQHSGAVASELGAMAVKVLPELGGDAAERASC